LKISDILPGLFTEIAILEHLTRTRFESRLSEGMTVRQFGILNYFVRTHPAPDSIAGIAWSFQLNDEEVAAEVNALAEQSFVEVTSGIEPRLSTVVITEAGKLEQARQLSKMGPEIGPMVSEIPVADLQTAYRVLHEIRLVMDNLPDR
jgi:hypothetical protein